MSFYLFFVSPLPALLSPAASCVINNLVSALKDGWASGWLCTSCFVSLTLLFFFLAAEDSSLSWGCEMSVISADLLKSTFFFFTLRWAASGCSPAASSGVLNSCCSHVECCERICMNFQPLGFFFFTNCNSGQFFMFPADRLLKSDPHNHLWFRLS